MLYLYLAKRRLSQNDDSLKRPTKILVELSQRSTMALSYLSQTGMYHPTGYGFRILSLVTGIQYHYHYLAWQTGWFIYTTCLLH